MVAADDSRSMKTLGVCGMLSAAGLLLESILWTASGWTPASFQSGAAALSFLQSGGEVLMAAVAAGIANLVCLTLLNIGIAMRFRRISPALSDAFLWFAMIGVTLHLLVPLSHWYGVNSFNSWASASTEGADSAWKAFYLVGHEAAGGGGKLFMGLSMLTAGIACLRMIPGEKLLGVAGILAGLSSVLTLFTPVPGLASVAMGLFMPSLALSMIFRAWWGLVLIRGQ